MSDNVHGTFVSHKVSKVRWKPGNNSVSETFITGSWDEELNLLKLWMYPENDSEQQNPDLYPLATSVQVHEGNVTEIKFVDNDLFLVSSSLGSVRLWKVFESKITRVTELKEITAWKNIHYFQNGERSSCNGIACYENDAVTIGEDGRINVLSVSEAEPVRCIDEADSCSMQCVCFLKHNEIMAGNLRGQMKIWDLRSPLLQPSMTFLVSGEPIAATCLTVHPSQKHIVFAGGEDGFITIWDLRQGTSPVTLLEAHSSSVNELMFHPDRPEHFMSCSANGDMWHWNSKTSLKDSVLDSTYVDIPWLSSTAVKKQVEIVPLMQSLPLPVNSFDLSKNRLILASDNEAIYIHKNLRI
nr:PREDICTED: nucleoporin Nup43 [Bemisia tabaci]